MSVHKKIPLKEHTAHYFTFLKSKKVAKMGCTNSTNKGLTKAWDNHFSAFGKKDLKKIMLDYTEDSEVIVWDTKKNKKTSFKGLKGVKALFTDLFANLKDLSTLDAPLIEVQETAWPASCCGEFPTGMVFLVWECPGCGYDKVTDTFIFCGDKIMRQNIVVFTNDLVEELKSGCC